MVEQEQVPLPRDDSRFDDQRVFVSIASYRDPDLPRTVADAFARAARPDRLRVGICQQFDDATASDLDPWADDPRLRIDRVPHTRARGVGWARARTQALYDHEPYYLQIDAHMRFEEAWDERYIAMLGTTDSERPILTNYPRWFKVLPGGAEEREPTEFTRRLGLEPSRAPGTAQQRSEPADADGRPGRHPYLAAGHLFTIGRFVRDVPYDPEIYYRGEEITLALRAYTHGYDLYWPHEHLMWHWYDHGAPLHWNDDPHHWRLQAKTERRVDRLALGDDAGMGRYGLGRRRTLAQYEHLLGYRLADELAVDRR